MRQLFATIDGGDDSSASDREREGDEENHTPSRKAKKSPTSKTSAKRSPKLASTAAFARTNKTHSPLRTTSSTRSRTSSPSVDPLKFSSDEDSDVEIRPRGRLAARMQANNTASGTGTASKSPEPLADNPRDRMKRMLQLAAKADKKDAEKAASQHPDDTNDAEDEEDVSLPAARPRKRLTNTRTAQRSASVLSNGGSPSRQLLREDSPAMFMTPSKNAERENSPDMFMSPTKGDDDAGDAAADGAEKPGRNARFQALVARKREEARAREEIEEKKREARQAAMAEEDDDDLLMADADDDNVSDITDDEGGRMLSQKVGATRPARKASKKALEEMHRETQRMSRNQQLVHEAKTRTKITKASLFERFNFKPQGAAAAVVPAEPAVKEATCSSRPTSPVSPHDHSEADMHVDSDTPPSSPPVPDDQDKPFSKQKDTSTTTSAADKGKGKAVEVPEQQGQAQPKRQVRVRMPVSANLVMLDSDNEAELEIVQTSKNKMDILFDSVPLKHEQEPRSMMTLRRLAQVGSPGRKSRRAAKDGNGKPELSLGELELSLQNRARAQAKLEREQRLEALRAKGIRIQTEEEREKEMEEVDNIVTRARQEAEEIMQREREEAKKSKKGKSGDDNATVDPLDWDDSDDEEDYTPEDDEEEMKEIELSGSEDEGSEEEDEDETMEGALIDDAAESAEESEDGEAEAEAEDEDNGVADVLPTPTRARPSKRRALIVSDDEDEDDIPATASATPVPPKIEAKTPGPKSHLSVNTPSGLNPNLDSPAVPTSVLRSATKPFIPGMPVAVGGPAGLGLTQIFAGTLGDDSQAMASGVPEGFGSPSQLMPTLGDLAEPDYSQIGKASGVLDSQPTQAWLKRMHITGDGNIEEQESGTSNAVSQMVDLNFSQSQVHGLDSLLREPEMSQMSLGLSQDMATQVYSPLKVRFIEHQPSTMETVVLDRQTQEMDQATQVMSQASTVTSSLVPTAPIRPRGRLFRKADMAKAVVEEEEEEEYEEEEEEEDEEARAAGQALAFAKMREASALEKKFRKKSKAKDMVEDQAEESEDEYAGLGGADGEDSDDESLASVKDLIDDQKVSSSDNAKLAAFDADRERENDQKQIEKLFHDVTTGALRRKRGGGGGGGDYDLSDSDDGGEARRRMKRRQFARMQKALYTDERVVKVAENPRNQAFMRTIEDRGSDDEMDFLFEGPAASSSTPATITGTPTEAAPSQVAIPDSQPTPATAASTHPRRRRASATGGKKPSNLGEIRESVSSLLEDHNGRELSSLSMVADSEFGSDDEDKGEDSHNSIKESNPLATASSFRRPGGRARNVQVVDRISLKRNNSSALSASSSATETGGAMGPTGFRVPALLRRATTNSLTSSGSSRSGSGRNSTNFSMSTTRGPADKSSSSSSSHSGTGHDSGKIKKNASKMSGIHSFARENERQAIVAENDKRRQAKKVRSAEGRSRAVGGLFGAGKFE